MEWQHMPNADGENDSTVMLEPAAIEPDITPEPEWNQSDQVCKPWSHPLQREYEWKLRVWIGAPIILFWTLWSHPASLQLLF